VLLTRDDVMGFKIFKNFSYYLEGVGLKVSSISSGIISKSSNILFKETFKERH
jgi:hypothetical protein